MNERIRELTRQAVIAMRAEKTDLPPLDSVVLDKILELREEYDQKFAELIVKECAEVAHCNFHVDGLTLGGILKEHFGLDE